jgi:hypothetical protein
VPFCDPSIRVAGVTVSGAGSRRQLTHNIGRLEATGAQNFLDLDDVAVTEEGEPVHEKSIISLPLANQRCVLPKFNRSSDDPFLRQVDASGMKW